LGEEGETWDLKKIGTEEEKMGVENELAELRKRLEQVENWKNRREEIEELLRNVTVEGGLDMTPPSYMEADAENTTGKETSLNSRPDVSA
jgi:ATP-binding cassette subfamily D (ALD) long-chain fatty acid import protein